MKEQLASKPRIYADFNSCMDDDRGTWCWCLRHEGTLLDEAAPALGAYDGMPVTLFYEDPEEEFEVEAILGHIAEPGWDVRWMALPNWDTMRRIRG
jgi:hypothetical protein